MSEELPFILYNVCRELADDELQSSFPALYRTHGQVVTDSSPSRVIDRVAQRMHDSTVLTTATGPIANIGRTTEPNLLRQLLQTTTMSRSTQSRATGTSTTAVLGSRNPGSTPSRRPTTYTTAVLGSRYPGSLATQSRRPIATTSTIAVVSSRNEEPYGSIVQSPSVHVTSPTSQSQPLTQTCSATGQLRFLTSTRNCFGGSLGRQLRPMPGAQLHLANASGRMQLSHTTPTGKFYI